MVADLDVYKRQMGYKEEKQHQLDMRYLRIARIWAENSYCVRRKVGALIVDVYKRQDQLLRQRLCPQDAEQLLSPPLGRRHHQPDACLLYTSGAATTPCVLITKSCVCIGGK